MIASIKKFFSRLFSGLFFGLKEADDLITSSNTSEPLDIGVHKKVHSNRVSDALLRGEVTQAVEELRYRTYRVDREAKEYEVFSPTLAKKYNSKDENKKISVENSDSLEVITVQPNEKIFDSFDWGLDKDKTKGIAENQYTLDIERKFMPRYKLEEYTKQLVVKHKRDKTYVLDFYVSKYQDKYEYKTKHFIQEIERMLNGGASSDVFDIKRISFTTHSAYKLPDMIYFSFVTILYQSVLEYDGHYVIRFTGVLDRQQDELEQFYSESMANKYENNAKKEVIVDLSDAMAYREYVCESCGKVMVYDPVMIDNMNLVKARDIDEAQNENSNSDVLSYLDAEISKEAVGHVLCKNCLKEYVNKQQLDK